MSERSIEQTQDFYLTRRVAAVVAPGWFVLASRSVPVDNVLIDHLNKRVEVGENTDKCTALALAIFGIAHARQDCLGINPDFCGRISKKSKNEKRLLTKLSKYGEESDAAALEWSIRTSELVYPHHAEEMRATLESLPRDKSWWHSYFSTT